MQNQYKISIKKKLSRSVKQTGFSALLKAEFYNLNIKRYFKSYEGSIRAPPQLGERRNNLLLTYSGKAEPQLSTVRRLA